MNTVYSILERFVLPYEDNILSLDGNLTVVDNIDRSIGRDMTEKETVLQHLATPFRTEQILLLYCHASEFVYRINMIEYHLRHGDLLIVPANSIGEIEIVTEMNGIFFSIGQGFTPVDVGIRGYLDIHEQTIRTPLLHLSGAMQDRFLAVCRQIEFFMQDRNNRFSVDLVCAYLKVLYLTIAEAHDSYRRHIEAFPARKMTVLKQFFELLEKNFRRERQVSFYADRLCLSQKYASQLIRNTSGKLAGDWIQERVILEAKLLLLDGKHNVQQVADELNFSSQSFFGRYFKQATGLSPKEYVLEKRKQ